MESTGQLFSLESIGCGFVCFFSFYVCHQGCILGKKFLVRDQCGFIKELD